MKDKKESAFEMLKVFDCQKFPKNVRKAFFDLSEAGNDCYVSWHVEDDTCEDYEVDDKRDLINKWLIDNGASPHEEVLINHWW